MHMTNLAPALVPPPNAAEPYATGVADLCIVIPVLNERDNIAPLVDRLRVVLLGISWEVMFVDDDSRDGTAALCESFGGCAPDTRSGSRYESRLTFESHLQFSPVSFELVKLASPPALETAKGRWWADGATMLQ